jgi:hypothetical protein
MEAYANSPNQGANAPPISMRLSRAAEELSNIRSGLMDLERRILRPALTTNGAISSGGIREAETCLEAIVDDMLRQTAECSATLSRLTISY